MAKKRLAAELTVGNESIYPVARADYVRGDPTLELRAVLDISSVQRGQHSRSSSRDRTTEEGD